MPDLAVSTWSLHRLLGPTYPALEVQAGERGGRGERVAQTPYGFGSLSLLDVPAYVAAMGIPNLEVCHFHFPRTDPAYLATLRDNLAAAGVRFLTLLIDAGDIAAADDEARDCDIQHIKDWIDMAAAAGAARVRVIAGATPPDSAGRAVRASIAAFDTLAEYARARGVAVITENWQALTARPEHLLAILDGLHGAVGLCADIGNYQGPTQDEDLRAILPLAGTVHAKAEWTAPGRVDEAAFAHCLDLTRQAGFRGTYVLIFDDAGDERASILQLGELAQPYLR